MLSFVEGHPNENAVTSATVFTALNKVDASEA
ncbi:MAG: hypothetical protein GAK28_01539 [Luteibacter sp.]|nr:MAG: hypothetical protein GAK28_01539 [Luteibacter sp.]